jgi:hypothetical protein
MLSAPAVISVGPACANAPFTLSVPPALTSSRPVEAPIETLLNVYVPPVKSSVVPAARLNVPLLVPPPPSTSVPALTLTMPVPAPLLVLLNTMADDTVVVVLPDLV